MRQNKSYNYDFYKDVALSFSEMKKRSFSKAEDRYR